MIKGINHVVISVANLARSIYFYRDLLGMEVVVQKEFEGAQYEAILALKGVRGKLAVLRLGSLEIELLEFERPHAELGDPKRPVCDQGISHFCIEVIGIQGEYERLKAAGVSFHCPPLIIGTEKATYGRDPDGNVFEMVELNSRVADGRNGYPP
jgi:catechol 2,3-dioxygenase-like lactoylglutathione lyase family enzyme